MFKLLKTVIVVKFFGYFFLNYFALIKIHIAEPKYSLQFFNLRQEKLNLPASLISRVWVLSMFVGPEISTIVLKATVDKTITQIKHFFFTLISEELIATFVFWLVNSRRGLTSMPLV